MSHSNLFSGNTSNLLDFGAEVIHLKNGLTVIYQNLPTFPVAVVDVWINAGAIVEPDEWSGMAHFLEHMVFKGTADIAPGQFDQIIESRGGATNAATSQDYAHFYITTSVEDLPETLPYLAELLLKAAIPESEFERERDVVLEELRQSYDNPDWLGFQSLMETIYHHHPYRRPVLGTETNLKQRTPTEMRRFHRTYYQPQNMTIVAIGGLDREETLDLIEQCFSQFPEPADCGFHSIEAEPPITEIRRRELTLPRIEQARLLMGWIGPGVEHFQSAYGLDLLAVLLAEGRTSRLLKDLREDKQWVQGVSSAFSLQRDSSLFTITAWLEPKHLSAVEYRICEHLMNLPNLPISSAELARCQRLLCNDYIFSTETPGQLAGLYGYYNTVASADISVTYPQQIKALRSDDLQRLATQYISPYRYAVTTLKPENKY